MSIDAQALPFQLANEAATAALPATSSAATSPTGSLIAVLIGVLIAAVPIILLWLRGILSHKTAIPEPALDVLLGIEVQELIVGALAAARDALRAAPPAPSATPAQQRRIVQTAAVAELRKQLGTRRPSMNLPEPLLAAVVAAHDPLDTDPRT